MIVLSISLPVYNLSSSPTHPPPRGSGGENIPYYQSCCTSFTRGARNNVGPNGVCTLSDEQTRNGSDRAPLLGRPLCWPKKLKNAIRLSLPRYPPWVG